MMSGVPAGSAAGRRWFAQGLACFCLLASTVSLARAQDPSPDRIVAEWMIRMGGSVILEGQRRPITDLAALPAGDFRIHTLNFTGTSRLTCVPKKAEAMGTFLLCQPGDISTLP